MQPTLLIWTCLTVLLLPMMGCLEIVRITEVCTFPSHLNVSCLVTCVCVCVCRWALSSSQKDPLNGLTSVVAITSSVRCDHFTEQVLMWLWYYSFAVLSCWAPLHVCMFRFLQVSRVHVYWGGCTCLHYRDLQVGWGTDAELKFTHAEVIDRYSKAWFSYPVLEPAHCPQPTCKLL